MATVDEDLRAFFLAVPDISDAVGEERIHKHNSPQADPSTPYVVFLRSGDEHERTTDQSPGEEPFRQFFDVEVYGDDVAAVDRLAKLIRALDCHQGEFGEGTVQGLFVEDHNDDYIPKANDADEIIDFAALQLEIVGYVPG